jgi:hypothetical protein
MTRLVYKVGSSIATAALLASTLAPAVFADNTVTIEGNGDSSTNIAIAASVDVALVNQSNNADVKNDVVQIANTGGNEANNNTDGNVKIDTGNASASSTTSTSGNTNGATVTPPTPVNNTVNIKNNGVGSTNIGAAVDLNLRRCRQANNSKVRNLKFQNARTGGNTASGNTGGDTTIKTGSATITSTDTTSGNSNTCSI